MSSGSSNEAEELSSAVNRNITLSVRPKFIQLYLNSPVDQSTVLNIFLNSELVKLEKESAEMINVVRSLGIEYSSLVQEKANLLLNLKEKNQKDEQSKQLEIKLSDHAQKNIKISELKSLIVTLKQENELLKEEIKELKEQREMLLGRLDKVEATLTTAQARDKPISIREAMRILENHICFTAAGSKNRYGKFFSFSRIEQRGDSDVQAALAKTLADLGLTSDHCDRLDFLKEEGDNAAHHRPVLTVDEWNTALQEEDDEEKQQQNIDIDLLAALMQYCPPHAITKELVIAGPSNQKNVIQRVICSSFFTHRFNLKEEASKA
jgi:hypothetical protein